jgi:hypothetical protein
MPTHLGQRHLHDSNTDLKPSTPDQDNTIWTPELYQLRGSPKAGKDIWLFDGARDALHELSTQVLMRQP